MLGWIGFQSSADIIEQGAIRAVGIVADTRRRALSNILQDFHRRAGNFITASNQTCSAMSGDAEKQCWRHSLDCHLATEEATAARITSRDFGVIDVGNVESFSSERPIYRDGQFAWFFAGNDGISNYFIEQSSTDGNIKVILQYQTDKHITKIFNNRYGLGESGETFLTDAKGFFLTNARYHTDSGHSHPIKANPMKACLSGQNGEILDPDYRGVPVIHGFRFVPEIGGACIMAHIDQAEAFAPIKLLMGKMAVITILFAAFALGIALIFSRKITQPLKELTRVAKSMIDGNFSARSSIVGPEEIQIFAKAFEGMTQAVRCRNELLMNNHNQLKGIVQFAPTAIIGIDRRGVITEWNFAAEKFFGWIREEAIGRCIEDLVLSRDSYEVFRESLMQCSDKNLKMTEIPSIEISSLRRTGEKSAAIMRFVKSSNAGADNDQSFHYAFVTANETTPFLNNREANVGAGFGSEEFPALGPIRILLIEDSADYQLLISEILVMAGAKVDVAGDGLEAVERAGNNLYDLILTDIDLPGIDGFTAAKTIRHHGFVPPIIAFSANYRIDNAEKCKESGINFFIRKPIGASMLLRSIASAFSEHCHD
jgi:PAS domain S-box-containing protein